jgi:hypothetical protein
MSYNYRIGRESQEWACGKLYRFSKFNRRVWLELGDEGRRRMPNPVAAAMESIKQATLLDAEIMQQLAAKDAEETAKAAAERRRAVLLLPQYRSLSDAIVEGARKDACRYLSAGSPELQSFIMSHEGGSYLFWLLIKSIPDQAEVTLDEAFDAYTDLMLNASSETPDGRKTPNEIVDICSGRAPDPAKNEPAPA